MLHKHRFAITVMIMASVTLSSLGCRVRPKAPIDSGMPQCSDTLQKIYYPNTDTDTYGENLDLISPAPMTLDNYLTSEFMDLSLEEAVQMALTNSRVLQRLGGTVVNAPQAVQTTFDPALFETNPQLGVEAALSAFDAQVASSLFFNHAERKFNNNFQALFSTNRSDTANFNFELSKQTAVGTRFAIRNNTDYINNHIDPGILPLTPFRFNSVYNTVNQFEVRQPLLRGAGASVNRIAGPNAFPGQYNGVMIARIRGDITIADFEAAVINLVRDVERNYWELLFSYRDLHAKIAARNAARETWENRQIRFEQGLGRPDEEAQARQQFYSFEAQVQNSLVGFAGGIGLPQAGVLGSERNLRRLLGLPVNDGKLLRPSTEPTVAPVVFDWNYAQQQTLERRVELRRQKWIVKQRELELLAARQLNIWRLDAVGQYGFRGFGDNLFGSRSRPEGSAVADMFTGELDDWAVGFELQGPLGMRQGHLAIRNAELQLVREKAVLREQQRQILHDLGGAYVEIDRALANIRASYNSLVAANEELEPKRLRVEEGKDQVFFLLDAQLRSANSESGFYRSVIDYNQAMLNFMFTEGSLLARYNIYLDEGGWEDSLETIARAKASHYEQNSRGAVDTVDMHPVTTGPIDQSGGSSAANR
ncbi:MAG: TolC family protein [Pirellulaceae bacterium]|nr:TolC family protein [Pirellulaceae bacterium]